MLECRIIFAQLVSFREQDRVGIVDSPGTEESTKRIAIGAAKRRCTDAYPQDRAPIHPGDIFLEEFLKPAAISQCGLSKDMAMSYPASTRS
jgi:hypothetical protein